MMHTYKFDFNSSSKLVKSVIQDVIKMELEIYPEHMTMFSEEVRNKVELFEYCEDNQVTIVIDYDEQWYLIMTKTEIIDLAAMNKLSLFCINKIYNILSAHFKDKKVELDARELSSYRLIKLFEKRNKLTILQEESWLWEYEIMYSMTIKFVRSNDHEQNHIQKTSSSSSSLHVLSSL